MCALFLVCAKHPHSRVFVYRGVLKEAKTVGDDALSGNGLHVDLDALTGISHLLIGLGDILLLWTGSGEHIEFSHGAEQGYQAASISSPSEPSPQLRHPKPRIPPPHISDQLDLGVGMLSGVTMWAAGLGCQGFDRPIVPTAPEVDGRACFIVLARCLCDTIFLCVLQQGLPIPHVLCYAIHGRRALLSGWFVL